MAFHLQRSRPADGRAVAVKVPHPEMECDPVLFDRFRREEEIARTSIPWRDERSTPTRMQQVYMVMEWVEGACCARFSGRAQTARRARDSHSPGRHLRGLEDIHTQACPPRPEARKHHGGWRGPCQTHRFWHPLPRWRPRLTFAKLSQVMGTPEYISPEQVKGSAETRAATCTQLGRDAL